MTESEHARGHKRFESDAAAYALGALEDSEVRPFEEHLAGCTQCRDQLAAMREVVDALPAALPARSMPGELKDRVMASVRSELSHQATVEATERKASAPGRRPIVTRPAWLTPGLVAATMAVVAVLAIVVVVTLGGGSRTRTYPGIVHAPGASASLRRSGSTAELRVSRLPAPPTGRIYEVWLERGGQRLAPTRVLFATSSGSVTVPGSLRGVQAVLVTDEPRPDGSLAPTRRPIIVVPLT
jgi:anti-sigma-K factor RskA